MAELTVGQALKIALQHHRAGRLRQAEQVYRQVLAGQPNHADALHYLGVIANQTGRDDIAVDLIRRAIALGANSAEAHCNLGNALQTKGRWDEAVAACRQSIALNPNYAEAHNNLGNALKDKGQLDGAIAAYRQAIALRPHYAEAHSNLGNALGDNGQLDEAIVAFRHAIALKPDYADAHSNLGVALREKGQLDEAVAAYRQAISLKSNSAQAHNNLGNALKDEGQLDEAIAAYRQAIVLMSDFPDAHKNLALGLLMAGNFAQGWEEYEWRWKCKDFRSAQRNADQPRWDGRPLAGATLLLYAEQGFGDSIQFIRYLPLVEQQGGKVIIECQGELQRLLQAMAGGSPVVARGQPLPVFDVQCLLLSLPRLFGTTLQSIPRQVPYLHADVDAAAKWRERLAPDANSIKAGLAWAGSKGHKDDRNRSIALSTFAPLGQLQGVSFFSLQKGDQADQARNPPAGLNLIDWTEDLADFADTAALIANLDLVITVDTAVAHLAGAMGKPVWVLLPFVADWRWLLKREDSPWYPTMRLFRQPCIGNWDNVVKEVTQALADLAHRTSIGILSQSQVAGKVRTNSTPATMPQLSVEQALQAALQHHHAGQFPQAEQLYRQILAQQPEHADALQFLGVLAAQVGRSGIAVDLIGRAITLGANSADAYSNFGNALKDNGQLDDAVAACRQAIALRPGFPEAFNNLGIALKDKGQLDEAIIVFRQAIALRPHYAEAHSNLGIALKDKGQLNEAVAAYRQAIVLAPNFAEAHWNLALALLLLGDFAQGWDEYEWRWKWKRFTSPPRNFPQPQWDGQSLAGATLLLHVEQGFGDTIQFMRYLPLVARLGARIIIECEAELERLIRTNARQCQVLTQGQPLPTFDLHCPLQSLPRAFGMTIETIPRQVPYLNADVQAAGKWRERLARDANSLKVGLAWAGRKMHTNDRNRSMTLSAFAPLAQVRDVSFFSLQKGERADQASNPPAGLKLIDWTESLGDFSDTAALIANLDLVIAVDTAVVHLAAAMGKPVWVLLPFVPDWRWLLQREDSPWYPTMRLFRQSSIGDWDSVIRQVTEALTGLAQRTPPGILSPPQVPGQVRASSPPPTNAQLSVEQVFHVALQHHQAGQLPQAEQLYRQILAQHPDHADALHFLGVIASQVGQTESAVGLIRRAIALGANSAEAFSNLGNALKDKGQLDEAIAACRQAIALRPGFPEAFNNLGIALKEKGQLDEAVAACRQAIALRPGYAEAYNNLGAALKDKGQLDEAIAAWRQAIVLRPNFPEAQRNLANVPTDNVEQTFLTAIQHHQAGQLSQAEELYRHILARQPEHAEALHYLGTIAYQMGRNDSAVDLIGRAIALSPNYAEAHSNLANVLKDTGQLDDAIAACRRAIALNPKYADAYNNLGNALKEKGQLDEAIIAYRQAIALGSNHAETPVSPNHAEAHGNLGNALRERGQLDEAIAAYRQAIVLKPGFPDPHWNLALALLTRGNFSQGWEEYEWRWKCKDFPSPRRDFPQPQWDGQPLAGATLLLYTEQGLGDSIQFIRYLPLLQQRGGKIVIECPAELQRLLQAMAGECPVVARGQPLPAFDVHYPLLSLPRVFGTTLENIPRPVPYLYADADAARKWRERLAGDSKSVRVGLAWAGSKTHGNDRKRSMRLSSFAPLAQVQGLSFFSLQKGEPSDQARNPPAGLKLIDWTEDLADFADTAALIANLDLVVAVDTAVAHLAGAMGKPVWVLLPFVADWRWLLERDDSPWYPTMRLFRQPCIGNWDNVVEGVTRALALHVAIQHHQAGQLPQAEQLYRQILAQHPDHADALHFLGVIASQVGQTENAADLIRRAIALGAKSAEAYSNLGNVLKNNGQLDEAVAACRQAIALSPGFPEAFNNLGIALKEKGQLDEAVAAYRQAVALRPSYAEAYNSLGAALKDKGQLDEAIAACRQAIALRPNFLEAHWNLGNALKENGQFDEAVATCRQAVALRPDSAEACNNLGSALKDSGQLDEAIAACQQAIALRPNFPEAYFNLGNALSDNGRLDDAVAAYRQAVAVRPNYAEAHNNLGNALKDNGQLNEAITAYRQTIALRPSFAEAHNNLGNALKDNGQLDEAIAAYRQAVALRPDFAEAHSNLGVGLQHKGHVEDAIAAYSEAIALSPLYAEAHDNLGVALHDKGQLDAAIACSREAIALKVDYAEAHRNLAFGLLLRGEFAEGWVEYEWRWKCKDLAAMRREFPQPRWDGRPLAGATLLLCAEQGFGDTLQFIRYLPLAQRQGGKIIIECQAELQRLLQIIAGDCPVLARSQPRPAFDLHCPMLSLPLVFETTLENIPAQVPYLHADPEAAGKWRGRLAKDANSIKVGLAWAGNKTHKNDRNRSMSLSSFAPLAQVPGVSFYSLQKGTPADQASNPPTGLKLIDWTEDLADFADTAALIASLDLVIAIDTAVAHLAGAMGKPVWVLLPFVPDWRWLLGRDDSPWYPTMRLFRQPSIGDWDSVMRQVTEALSSLK